MDENQGSKLTNNSSTNTFDPSKVKLKLKKGPNEKLEHEISLSKKWLKDNIPHISSVIKDVKDDEGVEITINCNIEAFTWIIDFLNCDN